MISMQLEFSRMVQFSLLVKAGDRVREFNFRKLKSPEAHQFTVNVCDERGDRILFGMQKEEGSWRISPGSLPGWIVQSENKLSQAVEEELSRWS